MPTKRKLETTGLSRKRVKILNISVDSTHKGELLRVIGQKLSSKANLEPFFITTPNPEIALEAQKDEALAEIISKADFCVPDGSGFKLVDSQLMIIHGRELMDSLLKLAHEHDYKVYFLGGTPEGIDKAIDNVIDKYPGLKINGEYGPKLKKNGDPVTDLDRKVNNDVVSKINSIKPDIVFVGFGAPKQEKWIWENKGKLKVKCLMTVGGAIDYYAGTAKLPPKWISGLELEWLWRLIAEPARLPRIFRAVVTFPLKVLLSKFSS